MPSLCPLTVRLACCGEQVDHGLGHGQRHARGQDRQQPQHRAAVRKQQQHDHHGQVAYSKVESMPLKILIWSAALAAGPPTYTFSPALSLVAAFFTFETRSRRCRC